VHLVDMGGVVGTGGTGAVGLQQWMRGETVGDYERGKGSASGAHEVTGKWAISGGGGTCS